MDELEMSEKLVCKENPLNFNVFIYASQRLIMNNVSYATSFLFLF